LLLLAFKSYTTTQQKCIQKSGLSSPISQKIQNKRTKHQAPSTKHQAPSTKHKAPSTKHKAQSTKHKAQSTKHKAQNLLSSSLFHMNAQEIKTEILRLTREYSRLTHASNRPGDDPQRPLYTAGDGIPYAGRVFNEDEVEAAVSSTLDFWLTLGPEGEAMERELAEFMGVKHCLL
jgi:hypothetical protein